MRSFFGFPDPVLVETNVDSDDEEEEEELENLDVSFTQNKVLRDILF